MFNFANSLPADALPATGSWKGFPAYNFIGGHNDAALFPVKALTDCMSAVMAAAGKRLAEICQKEFGLPSHIENKTEV